MPKYITCITRVLLNARRILMTSCPGDPALYDTHCQFCHYWADNQADHDDPEEDLGNNISRENLSEQSDESYILEDDKEDRQ